MERKVIGLDFGSSQSSIAVLEIGTDHIPELLNVRGGRNGVTIPTLLALDANDNSVIEYGNNVSKRYKEEKDGTIKFVSNFKRYLGLTPSQNANDIEKNADLYSFLFLRELANFIKKTYNVTELDPRDYVTCLAHPATWTQNQVGKLKKIAEEAGFPVDPEMGIYSVQEPVAAMHSLKIQDALKFRFGNKPENYMVIDYGGGTLDICIIRTDILGRTPKIISTAGDPMLGGKEYDEIIEHLFFRNNEGIKKSELASWELAELKVKFKEAKEAFSENFKNNTEATQVFHCSRGQFTLTISRTEFENICKDRKIFSKISSSIHEALQKAKIEVTDIKKVILTGGSSKWYFVRSIVANEFSLGGDSIFLTDQPFTDVANGCAIKIGRPDSPPERPGVWIQYKLENNPWSAPKCVLQPGRNIIEKEDAEMMFITAIKGTRYLKPYRITLRWLTGFEEEKLKRSGEDAEVVFYARSNVPVLDRLHGAWKGLRGLENKPMKDEYKLYLQYKEDELGTGKYQFKLCNYAASVKEQLSWEGDDSVDNLPDGRIETGMIVPGSRSYRGLIGIRKRKLIEIKEEK